MGNQALCGPPQLKVPPSETSNVGQSTIIVIVMYLLLAMIATILALFLIFALLRTEREMQNKKVKEICYP